MDSRPKLAGASIVRFVAAMIIVMYHVALLPALAMPDSLKFITSYGGFGVPLFYMLSAFSLSYGYFGKLETADQIRNFYTRRFFRIAPLFYSMMLFSIWFFWLTEGRIVSAAAIFTSATFTFNLIPQHVAGFVLASWSIGVEMLFYAIFPMMILLVSNLWRALLVFAIVVFIVCEWMAAFAGTAGTMQMFGNYSLLTFLHYFVAGMLAFQIWRQVTWTQRLHRLVLALSIVCLIGLIFATVDIHFQLVATFGWNYGQPLTTAVWAVAFIIFILVMSFEQARFPGARYVVRLGEASFSLYLVHPIIIVLLHRAGVYVWIYGHVPWLFGAYFIALIATLIPLFAVALVTYSQIERRFQFGWTSVLPQRQQSRPSVLDGAHLAE